MGNFFWSYTNIQVNPCLASLPSGLIAYYKLNDTTNTLIDAISANNFLNSGGNLGQAGLLNTCLGFDTLAPDFMSGNAIYNNQNYPISLSFWIKFNAISNYSIINWGATAAVNKIKPYINLLSSGNMNVGIMTSSGTSSRVISGLTTGVWHNITLLTDIANKKFYTSLNGENFAEGLYSTAVTSYDGELFFARYKPVNAFMLNGFIDDIKVWNRLISNCENKANYNNGVGVEL